MKTRLIRFDDQPLQPHQRRVIERIKKPGQPGLVVAHGLGSGKTRTAIEAHKALGGDADVVLPSALKANYQKEVVKWGADPDKSKIISQQAVSLRGPEALQNPTLIVDEGHRARNPKSQLSDAIKGSKSKKRLILTGTPNYNNPADLATIVNQAAGKPVIREGQAFKKRYLNPGLIAKWRGKQISHEGELKKILNQYVDYHKGDPSMLPKVSARTIPVEMSKHQSDLYRASTGRIPAGLKMHAKNIERLSPYLTGARQVSNTSKALDPASADEPKLDRVFSDLQNHLKNPKGKALIYSNWLEHGIKPIHARLEKAGVPHGIFTGDETPKVRNQHVTDYNSGKTRALIVSSSGAEGLDLKGTRLVQVVEPHFNNAKLRQVVGRSARMGSHTHLPEQDRNVEVRQYVARPKRRFFGGNKKGVDDFLSEVARGKDETDRQITALLGSRSSVVNLETSETTSIRGGGTVDVIKLIDLLKNRNTERVPISSVIGSNKDGGFSRSKKSGFSKKRYINTDTKHPLIIDKNNNLINGRHRALKLIDTGKKNANVVRATERDIQATTIKFAEIAKKYLVGTEYGDTPSGRAILDAVTRRRDPIGPGKPEGFKTVERDLGTRKIDTKEYVPPKPGRSLIKEGPSTDPNSTGKMRYVEETNGRRRLPTAKDFRDEDAFIAARDKAGITPPEKMSVQDQIANVRKDAATKLRTNRKLVHGALKIQGAKDTIPARIHNKPKQYGASQPMMGTPVGEGPDFMPRLIRDRRENLNTLVKNEVETSAGPRTNRLHAFLHKKVTGSIMGDLEKSTAPYVMRKTRKQIEQKAANDSLTILHNTIQTPPTVMDGFGSTARKPLPDSHYESLAGKLGKSVADVRKIHEHAYQTAHPKPSQIADRMIKTGRVFSEDAIPLNPKAPKVKTSAPFRTDLKGAPTLKKIAIGAGVVGAAALVRKLLNKGDDKQMSARGKLIQFGRGDFAKRFIAQHPGMVASAIDPRSVSKIAEGAAGDTLKIERGALAGRIRYARRSITMGGKTNIQRNSDSVTSRAEDLFSRKVAVEKEQAARSKVKIDEKQKIRQAVKHVTDNYTEQTRRLIGEHTSEVRGLKRGQRRQIIIAGAAGGTAGVGAGYAARKPDEEIEFTEMATLMKPRIIRLSGKDTKAHDIAVGAIEGGAGVLATDRLIHKFAPPGSHISRKVLIGAGVGGIATGAIGMLINKLHKNPEDNIGFDIPAPSRAVSRDRYTKKIHESDIESGESNILRSGIGGAAVGSLLKTKLPRSKAALIGAGVGAGSTVAIRSITSGNKDAFGDRPYADKRIEKLPWQAAGLAAAGLVAKRSNDQLTKAKIGVSKMARRAKVGAAVVGGAILANKLFFQSRGHVIQLEEEAPEVTAIRNLLNNQKKVRTERRPRHWSDKWVSDNVNVERRSQDLRTYTNRAGNILSDVKSVVKGERAVDERGRPKKREWDRPWAKVAATAAILGGAYKLKGSVVKMAGPGMEGPIGGLGERLRTGKVGAAMANTFPRASALVKKVRGVGQKAGDEGFSKASQEGGVIDRINKWIDKKSAGAAAPEKPKFYTEKRTDGSEIRHPQGSQGYDRLHKRAIGSEAAAAEKAAAEKAKKAASGIKRGMAGEHNFSEDTVYGDDWEHWVRNRPGVIKRNRPPKKVHQTKAFDDAVIKPSIGAAGFLAGVAAGTWGAHRGRKVIETATGVAAPAAAREIDLLRAAGKASRIIHQSSLDPLIELSSKLDGLLTYRPTT